MGIYSNGKVYGVIWHIYDDSGNLLNRFDKKYPDVMTQENIQEVKIEFDQLTSTEKNTMSISFYTMVSTTYGDGEFLSSWPGSMEQLQELFDTGDTRI